MEAREGEMRRAEGAQALHALLPCVRERAGTLEAHAAEPGLFKRRLPRGVAAMPLSFAQRGPGDRGPAVTPADGVIRPGEQTRRGRDDVSRCGKCAGPRTCSRTSGEPGIVPLEGQVNRPARGSSYVLPAWRTRFAVEHPFQERRGCFAPRLDLAVAESVLRAVAQDAPQADEACYAQRPVPPEEGAGAVLGVSVAGQGGPMLTEEAVKLKARWGPGAKRQQKKAALVGGSTPVEATPRAPDALAELLVDPDAARARRQRAATRDEAPRAQQVRRVARLVRTTHAVMAGLKAEAERRDPPHRQPWVVLRDGALGLGRLAPQRFKPWTRVTGVLDILPGVGALWSAAHARFGEASPAGKRWGQPKLTAILRGRVGAGIGGLRQLLTKPRRRKAVRETLAQVITCFPNHRRWRHDDADLAAGLPVGTGVVASACGSVVKPRMEGDGKRWSLAGAEALLTWRALKKSHDHDLRDDWKCRARQMRSRLYGHTPHARPAPQWRRVA